MLAAVRLFLLPVGICKKSQELVVCCAKTQRKAHIIGTRNLGILCFHSGNSLLELPSGALLSGCIPLVRSRLGMKNGIIDFLADCQSEIR